MNSDEYTLQAEYSVINEKQAHVPTDKGVIFLDTSVTIDGQSFDSIQEFLNSLYN
jgi:uncharacterized protein YacL